MSFFNIIKAILERVEDRDHLFEMDRLLGEKLKAIDDLQMERNSLMMELTFATMEHYTLSNILQHTLYRKQYAEMIETELDKLLGASLKLGFVLERVQWHKLLDYDELANAERKKEHENIQREMNELYARMESRQIVAELRHEQQKRMKLLKFRDKCKITAAKQSQLMKIKCCAVEKKRNNYILELVKGSKVIEELRLKIQQKQIGTATSPKDNISLIQKSSFDLNENILNPTNESLLQHSKNVNEEKPISEVAFKPLKNTLKFTFNAFNFEEFDLKKIQEKQKNVEVFDNNFHISMPFVCRDFMSNQIDQIRPNQCDEVQNIDMPSPKRNNRKCEEQNQLSKSSLLLSLSNDCNNKKELNNTFAIDIENSPPEPMMMIDVNENMEEKQREKENSMSKIQEENHNSTITYKEKMDITQNILLYSANDKEKTSKREFQKRNNDPIPQKGKKSSNNPSETDEPNPLGMDIFQDWCNEIGSGDSNAIIFSDQENPSAFSEMSSRVSEASTEIDCSDINKQKIF